MKSLLLAATAATWQKTQTCASDLLSRKYSILLYDFLHVSLPVGQLETEQ